MANDFQWSFCRLNWERFQEMAELLEASLATKDFSHPVIASVIDTMDDLDTKGQPLWSCHWILIAHCTTGIEVQSSCGLPEFVHYIRKKPHGEEVADVLTDLLAGNSLGALQIHDDEGIVGIFDPHQTRIFDIALSRMRSFAQNTMPPKKLNLRNWFSGGNINETNIAAIEELVRDCVRWNAGFLVKREG